MKAFLLSVGLMFISAEVFCWGDLGHRTIGEIAQIRLTPKARKGVKDLLGQENLAAASVWADEMRSDPQFTHLDPWHFVEISIGEEYSIEKTARGGDVLQAMRAMEKELLDPNKDKTSKQVALRLLAHFIGDVHQPLHVGNGKDQGGNLCSVKWMGRPVKLHVVWDSLMIESLDVSYTEWAREIDHPSAEEVKAWTNSKYEDWVRESAEIRESIYPPNGEDLKKVEDQFRGKRDPAGRLKALHTLYEQPPTLENRTYCKTIQADGSALPEKIEESSIPYLEYVYRYKNRKLLQTRILQAGVRLAGVLNTTIFK